MNFLNLHKRKINYSFFVQSMTTGLIFKKLLIFGAKYFSCNALQSLVLYAL
jgi:hypothetical protein